ETISAAAIVPAAVPETISAVAAVLTVTAAPVKVDVPSTRKKRVVIWDPEEESSTKTPTETKSKDKGKGIMVEEPKPMKKKQQVKLDEAYARKLHEEINQDIDWDVVMDHVKQKAKEDPFIQRYQVIKKRPQTEAQARRNVMEVEDLKLHLEIVPDEDDDVYTKATLLARKVPVVDYQIISVNNKPQYKIIKVDGTHQLQDNVWKSQRSVHGQALVKSWKLLTLCEVHIISFTTTQIILLVERRYPLTKFTLEQLLNVVRLQVEEQSEMYLELIR
nr:hypothetical protein [Tanacetum cinerariifolium]